MTAMPDLRTERLLIRRFRQADLDDIHRVFLDAGWDEPTAESRELRRRWLDWAVANYDALAALYQPPYGDRAIALASTGELVGSVGLVPAFGPFGQLPYYQARGVAHRMNIPEVGLFWALRRDHQKQGYAAEAARAVIDYAFEVLRVARVVATTTHDNAPSIAVMRRLGMAVERNPLPEPPWFQVIGILDRGILSPDMEEPGAQRTRS
jgi:RimJ/RimL family protein N-acetyltransferase